MIFAIAAALLTAVLLYMLLFKDWDDFLECVKFWLIPDIVSMFRGKYWEDAWAGMTRPSSRTDRNLGKWAGFIVCLLIWFMFSFAMCRLLLGAFHRIEKQPALAECQTD